MAAAEEETETEEEVDEEELDEIWQNLTEYQKYEILSFGSATTFRLTNRNAPPGGTQPRLPPPRRERFRPPRVALGRPPRVAIPPPRILPGRTQQPENTTDVSDPERDDPERRPEPEPQIRRRRRPRSRSPDGSGGGGLFGTLENAPPSIKILPKKIVYTTILTRAL